MLMKILSLAAIEVVNKANDEIFVRYYNIYISVCD